MPTNRLLILTIIFRSCFFELGFATSRSMPSTQGLTPRVDERVELLSIVFRLAGNAEYRESLLPVYSGDIDRYFAAYKNHPVVPLCRWRGSWQRRTISALTP